MPRIVVTALMLAALAWPAAADMTGPAIIIDGDTLVIAGERIRLEGIDAPELHQDCTAYGQPWACGRTSAEWLREHLNGRQVECVGHARDRYGRLLAVCYVGGESINERIVREGWAPELSQVLDGLPVSGMQRPSAPVPASGAASSPRHGSGARNAADRDIEAVDRRASRAILRMYGSEKRPTRVLLGGKLRSPDGLARSESARD